MSYRRVRIYRGPDSGSNVIGFSATATGTIENPAFAEFMDQRGYDCHRIDISQAPEGSVSWGHVLIRPPLTSQHAQELGTLCCGGIVDGKYTEGIVDTYNDGVAVLDNRQCMPDQPFGSGVIIARN